MFPRRCHSRRYGLFPAAVFIALAAVTFFALMVGLTIVVRPALGHPSDAPYAEWFNSLKQPNTQTSCCSISDCHDEPYRQTKEGYEVFLEDEWVEVPPRKILQGIENPTGHAVTCHAGKTIFCFVRETEG